MFDKEKYLEERIENHQHWLNRDCKGWEGMRLKLYDTSIMFIDLSDLDLSGAIIVNCLLRCVDLINTKLIGANLAKSMFFGSNLTGVDLSFSNLNYTKFIYTDLEKAIISRDIIDNENKIRKPQPVIYGADFSLALNLPYLDIPMACPTEGSFIGWKKVFDDITQKWYIVKLEIPEDAKRSSATTDKCRCDKAKVLGIYTANGTPSSVNKIVNSNYSITEYIVGEMVYPNSFDDNRFKECSNGIHFFMDKDMALNY